MPILPTAEQIAELVGAAQADPGPVVMLNLLRFKGGGGDGQATYERYGAAATAMVEATGGRVHLARLREGYSTTRLLQRLGAA